MPLFGERQPCGHCGNKVKRPKSADVFLCPSCGKPGPWASQDQIRQWDTWEHARGQYRLALAGVIEGSAVAAQELIQLAPLTGMSESDLLRERVSAFVDAANQAIGDQILTPDENRHLYGLLAALHITWDDAEDLDPLLQRKAARKTVARRRADRRACERVPSSDGSGLPMGGQAPRTAGPHPR